MNLLSRPGSFALMTGTFAVAADTQGPYRPDPWITTKTKLALLTADNVSGTRVNVDTRDGVVVLTGSVGSDAEKDKAIRLAKETKGVRSVEANLTRRTSRRGRPAAGCRSACAVNRHRGVWR